MTETADIQNTMDSVLGNAYVYGREWIGNKVRNEFFFGLISFVNYLLQENDVVHEGCHFVSGWCLFLNTTNNLYLHMLPFFA